MSERKRIGVIDYVTDTDNGYDFIGEVDGGFDQEVLESYIRKYGIDSLSKHLSYLQWQMFDAFRKINSEQGSENVAKQNVPDPENNNIPHH